MSIPVGYRVPCVLLSAEQNAWRLATPEDTDVVDGEVAWLDEALKLAFVRIAVKAQTVEMTLRSGSGPGGKPLRTGRLFGVKRVGDGPTYRQAEEGETPDCMGRLDAALDGVWVPERDCMDPTRGLVYVQETTSPAIIAVDIAALEAALEASRPKRKPKTGKISEA